MLKCHPKILSEMTFSGKDCFTKVVPIDDIDIWTPSPDVRMPPSSKDPRVKSKIGNSTF